jgi:iron complex transport system permease protein
MTADSTRKAGTHRTAAIAVFCAVLLSLFSLGAACMFGPFPVALLEVVDVLLSALSGFPNGSGEEARAVIVFDIRLSRACLAWLAGGALAVSGAVFQGLLRNPLADPFTLGVSGGAAFGAGLAIFCGLGGSVVHGLGVTILPLAALAGGLGALFLVIGLGRVGGTLNRETLILAGIVVSTFLGALISLLKALDEEGVGAIVFWIMGSFQGRGWSHAGLLLPYAVLGLLVAWRYSRELDLLSLGESQAGQLGVDVSRVRLVLLIASSLMTGAAVAVSGVIGFVGLVVPHLVRMVIGAEHRPLLAVSGLLGGVLLLWSDVLARTLLPGGVELPVGVVTALLGGPFFCLLLRRRRVTT